MNLEFIEDGHRYLLDGEEIPSVSEIIRFAEREVYQEPNKFQMEQAADRGKRIHKACEQLDRTGTCECDPDIAGCVNAYAKFLAEHRVKWELIEEPVVDPYKSYAGTLDRYGEVDGHKTLLDIKSTKRITGKHKVLYSIQLALYRHTLPDSESEIKHVILQLCDDGTYKLIKLENRFGLAASCLALHEAFKSTKRRKKNG